MKLSVLKVFPFFMLLLWVVATIIHYAKPPATIETGGPMFIFDDGSGISINELHYQSIPHLMKD